MPGSSAAIDATRRRRRCAARRTARRRSRCPRRNVFSRMRSCAIATLAARRRHAQRRARGIRAPRRARSRTRSSPRARARELARAPPDRGSRRATCRSATLPAGLSSPGSSTDDLVAQALRRHAEHAAELAAAQQAQPGARRNRVRMRSRASPSGHAGGTRIARAVVVCFSRNAASLRASAGSVAASMRDREQRGVRRAGLADRERRDRNALAASARSTAANPRRAGISTAPARRAPAPWSSRRACPADARRRRRRR